MQIKETVVTYLRGAMSEADSVEEARRQIEKRLPEIEKIAEEKMQKEGYDYKAQAELGQCYFPVKEYGDLTFPAGEYEALRLVIGEGRGHNWWCVMYPNLCFSNSLYRYNDKEWKRFQKTLTPREYRKILESGNYTIRFKFLEYFR